MPGQLYCIYRDDLSTCGIIDLMWYGEVVSSVTPIYSPDFTVKIWRPTGGARRIELRWQT
jgi:hypothetical protein